MGASAPVADGSRGWETVRVLTVLGIDVDADLLSFWRAWIAPDRQPFFLDGNNLTAGDDHAAGIGPELRDTYTLWNVDRPSEVLWLSEPEFAALPRSERATLVRSQVERGRGAVPVVRRWLGVLDATTLRIQADGHRFVWWPSLIPDEDDQILTRIVEEGGFPSRHRDIDTSVWRRASGIVPGAEALGGTFCRSSGPNCFGTVMAAAGIAGAADEWMLQEPFLDWLRSRCEPGGTDDEPGTVLVWFNTEGLPVHAAVTIGGGWALEKPSQCWWTPRVVLRVDEVIRANRAPGQRLRRHRIG